LISLKESEKERDRRHREKEMPKRQDNLTLKTAEVKGHASKLLKAQLKSEFKKKNPEERSPRQTQRGNTDMTSTKRWKKGEN